MPFAGARDTAPTGGAARPWAALALALLVALTYVGAAGAERDPVGLKFGLAPGRYVLTVDIEVAPAEIDGRSADTDAGVPAWLQRSESRSAAFALTVSPATTRGQLAVVAYQRLRRDLRRLLIDTEPVAAGAADAEIDAERSGQYRSLLGASFDVTLDAAGAVERVSNVEEVRRRLTAARTASHELEAFFAPQLVAGWLSAVRGPLPPAPVRVGDGWTISRKVPVPMLPRLEPIEVKENWTLKSLDRSAAEPWAELALESHVNRTFDKASISRAVPGDRPDGLQKVETDLRQVGSATIDLASGAARRRSVTTDSTQKFTVRAPAGGDESHTLRQRITVSTRFAPAPAAGPGR